MIALLLAATTAALPPGPLDFTAQDMRIEPKGHRVFLDGDVHLERGDLTVTGDHAVAEYKQQAAKKTPKRKTAEATLGGEAVDRFTVDGKVHVQRGTRTADGDHGACCATDRRRSRATASSCTSTARTSRWCSPGWSCAARFQRKTLAQASPEPR